MFIKIHKAYREVIAICDEDLIGKKFEEGKKILYVKESFFKGEKIEELELIKQMQEFVKSDATFNIVGEKSIRAALKAGIINKEGIKKIKEIPYALVLL
ncbi:MAG: DUF424 family protein [Candidatus Pacearchaeota archaeon]